MTLSASRRKANDKYIAENYSRIALSMPNVEAQALREYCASNKLTIAGFIRRAIVDAMARDTGFTDDLDAAIRLVADATGETPQQLITRNLMQHLHHDVEGLACGDFVMSGGYDHDRINALNEVVTKATGIKADEWILKHGSPMSEDARQYVKDQRDPQRPILYPGEVTARGDIRTVTGDI